MEHAAAFLGIDAPVLRSDLVHVVRQSPDIAQLVFHHQGLTAAKIDITDTRAILEGIGAELEVVVPPEVLCAPSSVVLRAVLNRRVSRDGLRLEGLGLLAGESSAHLRLSARPNG